MSVERVMTDVCSSCKKEWDTYEENGKTLCGYCGEEICFKEGASNGKA